MSRKSTKPQIRTGREQAREMAGHGGHLQMDRQAAHRMKVIPNKRREQSRNACRGRW